MAAPTPTPRVAPSGVMLGNGHPTLFAFEDDAGASFWERTVTPPGIDGGDAIELTTMHNVEWRTMAARTLKTLTDGSATVGYDPAVFDNILALINVEQSITIHFPDGSSLAFYGFLRTFEPSELSEGEVAEATVTITPTNRDPATGAEEEPVYTPPSTA